MKKGKKGIAGSSHRQFPLMLTGRGGGGRGGFMGGRGGPGMGGLGPNGLPFSRTACRRCGQEGHYAADCPLKREGGDRPPPPRGGDFTCHGCGESGHIRRNCPKGM